MLLIECIFIQSGYDECYKCQRSGHWARDCTSDRPSGRERRRSSPRRRLDANVIHPLVLDGNLFMFSLLELLRVVARAAVRDRVIVAAVARAAALRTADVAPGRARLVSSPAASRRALAA